MKTEILQQLKANIQKVMIGNEETLTMILTALDGGRSCAAGGMFRERARP